MTRQIYPHYATPSVFAVEERLLTVEARLHRMESVVAMLAEALGMLADGIGGDSHEDWDEDGSGQTVRRVHALLTQAMRQVSPAPPGPCASEASV
jgi:hypothetical protein